MLRFFRNIRQKLIENGNLRKYFWYALGEILLVMIGILLALQVNNWNESRKAKDISEITKQNLKAELTEAKSHVEARLEVNNLFLKWSDNYLNSDSYIDTLKNNPSLIFRLISSASITLDLPILQQELSSNQKITDRSELTIKLRQVKAELDNASNIEQTAEDLWNRNVVVYFLDKQFMTDFNAFIRSKAFNEEKVISLLYDEEYKNLVAMVNSITIQYIRIYENLLVHIDDTIELIETIN
ncbi:MAG: hypothetical protein JJ966_05230 [Balneolaceae bacterium]|nr:hypothetical protein [Balneolaceae bacterium]